MTGLVTQIVRTVLQFVWATLASWGVLELVNQEAVELWLTTLLTGVLVAVLAWLERKFPIIGRLFVFDKTPSY